MNTPRRRQPPLPVKDGLSPSRVRLGEHSRGTLTAFEFLSEVIATQRHRHPEDTADSVRARFTRGEVVSSQGVAYGPDDPVSVGADVWFYRIPAPEPPAPFRCRILHHDENLLVVHKPPFLSTMPRGRHITETATVQLRRETGNNDLVPAHRLDRLTAGVLMFTTRPEVRGAYQRLFAERQVDKTYTAIAPLVSAGSGEPIVAGTVWRSHIAKTSGEIQAVIQPDLPVNAVTEVTSITPLAEAEQAEMERRYGAQPQLARYELHPRTGRTHQLRLHMNAAGVPIVGDPFYPVVAPDAPENYDCPLQLISTRLAFIDPLSGQPRCFTTEPGVEELGNAPSEMGAEHVE